MCMPSDSEYGTCLVSGLGDPTPKIFAAAAHAFLVSVEATTAVQWSGKFLALLADAAIMILALLC